MSDNLRGLLHDELAGRDVHLDEDTPLLTSRLLDSVGLAFLLARIAETEGVHIPDEAIRPCDFESLRRIRALVDRHRRPGAG